MSHQKRFSSALVVTALIAATAGCSSPRPEVDDIPLSTGSWAEEMQHQYQNALSPEIRATLEDGKISDQEYAEMKDRYRACMSAAGVTLTRYDFEGGSYTHPASMSHDEAQKVERRCSDESGEYPIGMFYVQMRVNPSHKDMAALIVDCYKRNCLVGAGYGLKDYLAGDMPKSVAKAGAVKACDLDPDGLLGG
jgi:hypothetical protein